MKTLILNNGTQVPVLECYAGGQYIQGAQRDVLDFRLDPASYTLDAADALFTADACGRVTIQETTEVTQQATDDDGNPAVDEDGNALYETVEQVSAYVHDGYVLRVALSKQTFTVVDATGAAADVEQISVQMAQQTAAEKQMASLAEQVTDLQLAACELYELTLGGAE